MTVTSICVDVWVQLLLPLLGVDVVKFSLADDKVCEWNVVGDVLVFVPSNNWIYTKGPVDEARYQTDSVLITETPKFIAVYIGEELNSKHVTYGLVGTF